MLQMATPVHVLERAACERRSDMYLRASSPLELRLCTSERTSHGSQFNVLLAFWCVWLQECYHYSDSGFRATEFCLAICCCDFQRLSRLDWSARSAILVILHKCYVHSADVHNISQHFDRSCFRHVSNRQCKPSGLTPCGFGAQSINLSVTLFCCTEHCLVRIWKMMSWTDLFSWSLWYINHFASFVPLWYFSFDLPNDWPGARQDWMSWGYFQYRERWLIVLMVACLTRRHASLGSSQSMGLKKWWMYDLFFVSVLLSNASRNTWRSLCCKCFIRDRWHMVLMLSDCQFGKHACWYIEVLLISSSSAVPREKTPLYSDSRMAPYNLFCAKAASGF